MTKAIQCSLVTVWVGMLTGEALSCFLLTGHKHTEFSQLETLDCDCESEWCM